MKMNSFTTPSGLVSLHELGSTPSHKFAWLLSVVDEAGAEIAQFFSNLPWRQVKEAVKKILGVEFCKTVAAKINVFGVPHKAPEDAIQFRQNPRGWFREEHKLPGWMAGYHLVVS